MKINLKFEYRDLTIEDLEILLQDLQKGAITKGGMVYSITKIKNVLQKESEVKNE